MLNFRLHLEPRTIRKTHCASSFWSFDSAARKKLLLCCSWCCFWSPKWVPAKPKPLTFRPWSYEQYCSLWQIRRGQPNLRALWPSNEWFYRDISVIWSWYDRGIGVICKKRVRGQPKPLTFRPWSYEQYCSLWQIRRGQPNLRALRPTRSDIRDIIVILSWYWGNLQKASTWTAETADIQTLIVWAILFLMADQEGTT